MSGQGPDGNLSVRFLNVGQAWDAAYVYHIFRSRQPQFHLRQEAMPSGQDLDILLIFA